MTTHTTDAREAAANSAIVEIARQMNAELANNGFDDYVDLVTEDNVFAIRISAVQRVIDDAFLAKALEGADEKLAEIQKYAGVRKGISEFEVLGRHSKVVESHRDYLLTLVTALSAKLKEVEETERRVRLQLLEHNELAGQHLCRAERAEAQLAAQKAAHAKLLRDEADVSDKSGRDRMASRVLRYLADKIEGGE